MIIPALSSKAVWKILYLFSLAPGKGLNRKEIKEFTKLGNNPLDQSLKPLLFFSVLKREGNIYRLNQSQEVFELLEFIKFEREKLRNINFDVWNLLFDFCLKMKRFCPDKIILFGSYAKGIASIHSDVDICVVFKEKSVKRELAAQEVAEKMEDKGKLESFPVSTCSRSAEKLQAHEWNNVDKFKKKIQLHFFEKKSFDGGKIELIKEIKKDGIALVG